VERVLYMLMTNLKIKRKGYSYVLVTSFILLKDIHLRHHLYL